MRTAQRAAWIATGIGLVIGIPVGALCAGAWRGGPTASMEARAPHAGGASATVAPRGADSALLQAELERLREELAARQEAPARVAIGPGGAPVAGAHAASDSGVPDELARLLESGALQASFASDPDGAGAFLFETYMRAQLPHEALRVLRAHDLPAESSAEVSQALFAAGDRAGATEALVLGLERHADDFDWRDPRWGPHLERNDPAGALAALERWKEARGNEPDARMDTRRAALLARLGRGAEARVLLDWVWKNSEPNELAWRALGEVDPPLAESRLLATLSGDGAALWDNQVRYMQFLRNQGRHEDLGRAAAAWLEQPQVDFEECAEFLLAEQPVLYADALQRRLAALPDDGGPAPELNAQLALAHERLGNRAAAVASCERTLAGNPFQEQAAQWLLERDPARYVAIAEAAVRSWNDAGSWGELGNQYLRYGRTDDARRAFEEARRLQPDEPEWTQRIAQSNAVWPRVVFQPNGLQVPLQYVNPGQGYVLKVK
ncbi:MAG: tetratricopeptide repeat protein [Planctomycetes bacterium]|nr:tetratricopeptide repeat protein [Planctomycetota bacterium]